MRAFGRCAVTAAALFALAGRASADHHGAGLSPCTGFGNAPDVATCTAQGPLHGGGERGALAVIACVVQRLEEWKLRHIECIQKSVNRRQDVVLWPLRALRVLKHGLRPVDTLRKIAEQTLSCGWNFSFRTEMLRDLFVYPVKLCRNGYRIVWGGHDTLPDADVHELFDWTSTLTHNLVQDRTIHEHGKSGELPEETWRRIGAEGAQHIGEHYPTPGQAARFEAQMLADRLRVDSNSLQLQAQTLLVGQQARDYRALKRRHERALSRYLVSWVARKEEEVAR